LNVVVAGAPNHRAKSLASANGAERATTRICFSVCEAMYRILEQTISNTGPSSPPINYKYINQLLNSIGSN